jgi:hypothetical protein
MTALTRLLATAASLLIVAACGAHNTTNGRTNEDSGIPSYAPGPDVPGASFTFAADDGGHPVDGRSGEWVAPDSEIMIREYENILKIDAADKSGFDYIAVELNAPGSVPLEVGDYPDARNRDRVPDGPGMLVISGSLGCDDAYGEFVIDRIERDGGGKLVAVDVGLVQSCGGADRPALHGRAHFRA